MITVTFFALAFVLSRGRDKGIDGRGAPRLSRYAKSGLTTREAERLLSNLDAAMLDHGWYRDPELTLAVLAHRLSVAPQVLSQALNQHRGQSLTDYLSGLRIQEAKRLLADPASDCYTVEGLSQQAGFASRSAFYRLFREMEGQTPAQFRESARPPVDRRGHTDRSATMGSH